MKDGVAGLCHYHSQHRVDILNLLDDGKSYIKSVTNMIEEKIGHFDESREQYLVRSLREVNQEEKECGDLHLSTDVHYDLPSQVCSCGFLCLLPSVLKRGFAVSHLSLVILKSLFDISISLHIGNNMMVFSL